MGVHSTITISKKIRSWIVDCFTKFNSRRNFVLWAWEMMPINHAGKCYTCLFVCLFIWIIWDVSCSSFWFQFVATDFFMVLLFVCTLKTLCLAVQINTHKHTCMHTHSHGMLIQNSKSLFVVSSCSGSWIETNKFTWNSCVFVCMCACGKQETIWNIVFVINQHLIR